MKNLWSDDDSSFQCPSQPSSSSLNSSSQQSLAHSSCDSSNPHISALETREDSFLENMYQFVRECLNNDGLMKRLNPKRHAIEDENENCPISLKHIKKPRMEPKINRQFSFCQILLHFLKQNKFQLLLIAISVAMIVVRVQDLYQQQVESRRQGCLKQYKSDNIEDLRICVENTTHLISGLSFLERMKLMFWDLHQFFYMGVILCASYYALKSVAGIVQSARISFPEYVETYKKLHKISGEKTISLNQLKEQFMNRQRSMQNGQINDRNNEVLNQQNLKNSHNVAMNNQSDAHQYQQDSTGKQSNSLDGNISREQVQPQQLKQSIYTRILVFFRRNLGRFQFKLKQCPPK